jgi:uncharacterized protein
MLKQQLRDELKQSMLARDAMKTSVLRMVLSALNYAEIDKAMPAGRQGGAGYEATDEDVMAVIAKEAKQHKDSIEQFRSANRPELVEKEEKELAILATYLPEQMGEKEVKKLVDEAVAKTGAATPADMGKVMGALMPQVKGKADGGLVSRLVREALH